MKFISIINTISKIISTVLIFFLVKSPDDVEIIPLLYTFSTIVVGVLSYKIIKSKFHVVIDFRYLNIRNIRKYLIDGWHFFVSNISISLYTNTLIFALGLFGTKEQVAYFSIPNKIVGILRMAFEPITQTLFPHFSNLLVSGELKLLKAKIKKVFIAGLIAISGVCIIIFVLSPFILRYLFNVSALESINNLRLQIWLPVILWFHVIFGYFYIVLQKMNKLYSKIILWSSVISIPISFYFINTYKDLGATITLLLVEIGIGLIYVYYYLKTKKTVYGE
jgi:PST family polysaccharide transporter